MSKLNNYQTPNSDLWQGRASAPEKGIQYWYQAIQFADLNAIPEEATGTLGLVGYACDEGVRRNLGRVGAKEAPDATRKKLAKLAFHHQETRITDFGNIACEGQNLEETQEALTKAVIALREKSIFPIIVGGGHDVAYGHAKGLLEGISPREKLGIINFDAHFDLRPLETQANSGTPFYQILEEFGSRVAYCALGIQRPSNTPELFKIARKHQVWMSMQEDFDFQNPERTRLMLERFAQRVDKLYLTIDLDGFASAYAPGVSAPSPMGFSPDFVREIVTFLFKLGKVIAVDFAELNPKYDQDEITANLNARLIDFVVGQQVGMMRD